MKFLCNFCGKEQDQQVCNECAKKILDKVTGNEQFTHDCPPTKIHVYRTHLDGSITHEIEGKTEIIAENVSFKTGNVPDEK
jgi:hypothetical protein